MVESRPQLQIPKIYSPTRSKSLYLGVSGTGYLVNEQMGPEPGHINARTISCYKNDAVDMQFQNTVDVEVHFHKQHIAHIQAVKQLDNPSECSCSEVNEHLNEVG